MNDPERNCSEYHEGTSYGEGGEWYLLREDVEIGGGRCRAGTPVQRLPGGWRIQGIATPVSLSLDGRLCKTEYAGLSLHVLSRESDGSVVNRRIGSDDPVERVAISRIITLPEFGHDKLYLAFGDQFYPLEYFGW